MRDVGIRRRYITNLIDRAYNQLWTKATVEAKETLIVEDLPHAVKTVLVEQLPDYCASLVLHSSLKRVSFMYRPDHGFRIKLP